MNRTRLHGLWTLMQSRTKEARREERKVAERKMKKERTAKAKVSRQKMVARKAAREANRVASQLERKEKVPMVRATIVASRGHYARDCWAPKRVQEVAEKTESLEKTTSTTHRTDGGQSGGASTAGHTHAQERICLCRSS